MIALLCHHLFDNYVEMSDFDVNLSDNFFDLLVFYVDLSPIHVFKKINNKTFTRLHCAIQLT